MKKLVSIVCIVLSLYAQDDKTLKVVPVISSNPTAGTGVGVMGTLMYEADEKSSPSQALLSLQYTNTESYSLFVVNRLFFDEDRWQSNSIYTHIYNNTTFSIDISDMPFPFLPDFIEPNFEVTIDAALQQFMYLARKNLYVGGQIFYVAQDFNAKNSAGSLFLISNGIESVHRGGLGGTLSYDTRSKSEKFYPKDATFINVSLNFFPKFMGSDVAFSNMLINARKYIPGYNSNDVVALQFLAQYCSEHTPDGALAALGARSVIRGFPIGKYKTRFMNAVQGEYRYTINDTRFRIVPFVGYAHLSGGSEGTSLGNRDKDNGDYYSGGVGAHYILSKKYQLDYRVDLAYSSDNETSVYASLNQAF